MALRKIRDILPSVLSGVRRVRTGSLVTIETSDDSREVLLGMLGSAVESGLLTSMDDITSVRVNGRTVSRSSLL